MTYKGAVDEPRVTDIYKNFALNHGCNLDVTSGKSLSAVTLECQHLESTAQTSVFNRFHSGMADRYSSITRDFNEKRHLTQSQTQNSAPWNLDILDATCDQAQCFDNIYKAYGGGANVQIWIMDSGVYTNSNEFAPGRATWDASVADGSTTDCVGHGTIVASIAAGTFAGVAKLARMGRANRRLKKDVTRGMFVALRYAVLDARNRTLTLCSAGQTQPVHVCGRTGEARLVETLGDTFPLGILDDADYRETRLELGPGDRVVFYTDGIVEAADHREEMFGFELLLEVVRGGKRMSADALLKEVLRRVTEFAGGAAQHDDLTVIVLGVTE